MANPRRSIRDRNKAAIAHEPDATPAPAAEPTPPAPAPAAVQTPAAAPKPEQPKSSTPAAKATAKTKYPPKVSFYQDPADTDRMRAALLHTMATENYRNLSQFVNEAVMEKVARLEKTYNGGNPFGAVGARELPQGRPMGE
ncbi:MAG: hypothetical protein JSS74_04070 [Actinobacteria bacterium]|nr:hypothetical protein [Actinomycetota bacterium]